MLIKKEHLEIMKFYFLFIQTMLKISTIYIVLKQTKQNSCYFCVNMFRMYQINWAG